MKKILSLLILLTIIFCPSYSQEYDSDDNYKHNRIISIVPSYLITHGIRIDYDFKIKERNWIQLAPQFYLKENRDYNTEYEYLDDYSQHVGAGLHLYHKIYFEDNFSTYNPYISYGPVYQFHKLNYDESYFNNTIERSTSINKFGTDLIFGVMYSFNRFFAIDFYGGVGFRYSIYSTNADVLRKFNESYSDFGYKGNLLTLGIRISFLK